ncbi:MmyB family transcriptional regulator [Streptomyces sp. NPDC004726]
MGTAISHGDDAGHNERQSERPLTGHVVGLGPLLRAWRAAAGMRLGSPVTQKDAAVAVGRSERWYRDLENGAPRRLDRTQCQALARVLQLGPEERLALLLLCNVGSTEAASARGRSLRDWDAMHQLVSSQTSPSYVTDNNWNILSHNEAMAKWWPWVLEPGANTMRWLLVSPEARSRIYDWHRHALTSIRLLKFATASRGHSAELARLIGDVCKDRDVRSLWETCVQVSENRDGHVFRMSVPALGWEPVDVISHVLYPASLPDCRFVVITRLQDDDAKRADSTSGRQGQGTEPTEARPEEGGPAHRPETSARRLAGRLSVATAETAAALAGDDGIPLPVLSQMISPGCQLTLSPQTRTVIWATREDDGRWNVTEVDPYTVTVLLPHAAARETAGEELKALTRAVLPADEAEAATRIQTLLPQWKTRIRILEEIQHDLRDNGQTLPHTWHPADEI